MHARLAFVVPRYGPTVVGGAETLCRMLAEDLCGHGIPVDVLTTCALDHFAWVDEIPAGEETVGGVRVRRFPVGDRDAQLFRRRHAEIDQGRALTYGEQAEWMCNSVWSPGMLEASAEYERLIALPYLYGTTFWSAVTYPDRTIMLPCLHDEAHARQPIVLDALASVRGVMLNAKGEGLLLARLMGLHRGGMVLRRPPHIVGGGFHAVGAPDIRATESFCSRRNAERGYLLYAGRRERAKGLVELFDAYAEYVRVAQDPKPLALMGSGDLRPPRAIKDHILDFGFVSEVEKPLAFAGAAAVVQPSRLESFGLVLFESWLAGTPAIVNARSDVLREHCAASGGGLWFDSPEEFIECAEWIGANVDLARQMGAAGREYTLAHFQWAAVRKRFLAALEAWQ